MRVATVDAFNPMFLEETGKWETNGLSVDNVRNKLPGADLHKRLWARLNSGRGFLVRENVVTILIHERSIKAAAKREPWTALGK